MYRPMARIETETPKKDDEVPLVKFSAYQIQNEVSHHNIM